MSSSEWVYLEVALIVNETDLAFLLRLDDGREAWVPKSVIADAEDFEQGDEELDIAVAEWFAEKEGPA